MLHTPTECEALVVAAGEAYEQTQAIYQNALEQIAAGLKRTSGFTFDEREAFTFAGERYTLTCQLQRFSFERPTKFGAEIVVRHAVLPSLHPRPLAEPHLLLAGARSFDATGAVYVRCEVTDLGGGSGIAFKPTGQQLPDDALAVFFDMVAPALK